MNGQSNYFIEDSGLPYIHLQQPNHHVNSDEESVAAAGFVVSPKPPHPENIQQQHHRIESVEKSNKSNNYFQFNTAIQLNASSGATTNFDEFHNNNNNNNTVKHLNQFPTIASAAEWASSVTSSATPSSSSTNINDNFPLSFTPIATKRAKRKRCADDDVPDEKWECVLCHVKAHMTPLKRKNPVDGKRNICNACYVRLRVRQERSERGMSRPTLPTAKAPTATLFTSSSLYSVELADNSSGKNLNVNIVSSSSAPSSSSSAVPPPPTQFSSSSTSSSKSYLPKHESAANKKPRRRVSNVSIVATNGAQEEEGGMMLGFNNEGIYQPLPTMASAAFPAYMSFFDDPVAVTSSVTNYQWSTTDQHQIPFGHPFHQNQ